MGSVPYCLSIASNDAGNEAEIYTYSPFGRVLQNSTLGNPYLYTGRRYDAEMELYYYRARMYNPALGRFLQPDPIGYAGGANLYGYVLNDPVDLIDPSGLDTYYRSRLLGAMDPFNGTPTNSVLSHSFVYTTNLDGSLKDTFSWGNKYDEKGNALWVKNASDDRNAARLGIEHPWVVGKGLKVGDETLDKRVESVFNEWDNDPNHPSHHKWKLWSNCKTEAINLILEAYKRIVTGGNPTAK